MREIGSRVGLLAVLAALAGTSTAEAASLKAAYQFQGSHSSDVAGAPDLVDLAPGNVFTTETVGGSARQVLAFPISSGVSLATAGLVDQKNFSVVMVFRLAAVSGYRRLLDFSGGSSDLGLYVQNGAVRLYGSNGAYAVDPSVAADSYVQVSLASEDNADGTQSIQAYVDGDLRAFSESAGPNFTLASGTLRLFKDDSSFGGEESSGAVACVAVYDGALTPEEVGAYAAVPTRCTPPPPPPPPPPATSPPPPPAPAPRPPFAVGTYVGKTSQGLPISFTVGASSVDGVYFRWRARCADGRVRTKGMTLGAAQIGRQRFSASGILSSGGQGRVSGRLRGDRASGTLSRWGRSASGATCRVRGLRWHAQVVRDRASES